MEPNQIPDTIQNTYSGEAPTQQEASSPPQPQKTNNYTGNAAMSKELQVMRYRYERARKQARTMTLFFVLLLLLVVSISILVLYPGHKKAVETSASLADDEVKIAQLETELTDAKTGREEAIAGLEALSDAVKTQGAAYDVNVNFMRKVFTDYVVTNGVDEFQFYPIDKTLPLHSYDWQNLKRDGATHRLRYAENGTSRTSFGIDVSKYQGKIDWKKVRHDGVDYAFIRLGFRSYGEEGAIVLDEYYEQNIDNATKEGIKAGVYFFSQATTVKEAEEEADFVLKHIKGKNIKYPVVFDTESVSDSARAENLTVKERTAIAKAFCEKIAQGGYTPMIYASLTWYMTALDLSQLTQYQKWYAGYETEPGFPYEFQIWQYSSQGTVDGITGRVDVNISFLE